MFETKSKTYARLERLAIESMRFYEHERVAVITVTQVMFQLTGSNTYFNALDLTGKRC